MYIYPIFQLRIKSLLVPENNINLKKQNMKYLFILFALISTLLLKAQNAFITEWTFFSSATQIRFNAQTDGGAVNYTWSASPSGNSGAGSFTQVTAGAVTPPLVRV